MNIYTLALNLHNTIAGKENHLDDLRYQSTLMAREEEMATKATIKFLEVNIDELKRIVQDVEVCCEQQRKMEWMLHQERMGQ
jgi:tetrahydromethanopterin S-methyltransferase subunit F